MNFANTMYSAHIGPSGGGMCTDDTTYPGTVDADLFPISYKPYGY